MTQYKSFIFKNYGFDHDAKQLTLSYGFDDELTFTETFNFDFDFVQYDNRQLDAALQHVFFMAGISYYKAFASENIVLQTGSLSQSAAEFFARTYRRGLGEFYYVNNLDPGTVSPFTATGSSMTADDFTPLQEGLLVGLGGGKDSLLSIEVLRSNRRVATWSMGHAAQLTPLVEAVGLPHFQVNRTIDPALLAANEAGARNGHVPISAILACMGTVVGILSGYNSVVVSNENSANEPTLHYRGHDINHQYSKSLAFEQDYQRLLQQTFGDNLLYFSLLRPLSELYISELFSAVAFDSYKSVFSSCNRAFTQASNRLSWCGNCPKCVFVNLMLVPFVPRQKLQELWDGRDLLIESAHDETLRQLLGLSGQKPLECVGEIKESRAAMLLAQQIEPSLNRFSFDIPSDYDYRVLAPHSMPDQYYEQLLSRLAGSADNVIK